MILDRIMIGLVGLCILGLLSFGFLVWLGVLS